MKTLIQKIIVNYFGKFIHGIQKDKLSVSLMSGNFQLQNISLNQQYFNKELNTPFKLTYSSIGKLNLQAPLSKLSSTPVQCTLDNIYAIFQFNSENEGQKKEYSAEQQFLARKQFLQKYIKEMFQTYLKKLQEKQEKKEDGMMSRMGKKIIDNLQLKIVNVHIRFEEKNKISNRGYGWGVKLQQISFVTTDQQWKPAFIDRSTQTNKNQRLLKKMNLKNFSIYWQSASSHKKKNIFINDLESKTEKSLKMAEMISETQDTIISLTSQFKLIINSKQNLKIPLYELSVELAPIKFDLERTQVSQMIDFAQKNVAHSQIILRNLSKKKKKSSIKSQFVDRKKYEKFFFNYVQNCIEKQQNKGQKMSQSLDQFEVNSMLKTFFGKIEDQQLLVMTLKPIRNQVKIARQKQLKKKKKGWFGGEYQLTQEQLNALSNFVQQYQEEQVDKDRPPQCLFFSISLLLNGGCFSFIENKKTEDEQLIQFKIGKIQTMVQKSQNQSILNLQLNIQSIALDLYLPEYKSSKKTQMNILMNDSSESTKVKNSGLRVADKFVCLKFTKKVETGVNPVIKTDITGEIKRIILTYKKLYMKKFKAFFTFKNFNQDMKNQTIKKWNHKKDKNEESDKSNIQETQVIKNFNINLTIISPLFICPLGKSDAWCLNLGKLSIQSERDKEKQMYPMKITSAYFRYYQNIHQIFEEFSQKQQQKKGVFSVINNINFTLIHTVTLETRSRNTQVNLPNFTVNFTESQYKNLLTLKEIFKIEEESQANMLEILKKNRQEIQDKHRFKGMIQKKNENIDSWKSFYAILSGQFIYLYGSEKQLKFHEKISIKQCRLEYNQSNRIITLINQHGIIQFTGNQHDNNTVKWKIAFEEQLKQFMSIYQIVQGLQEHQQSSPNRKRKQTSSLSETARKKQTLTININKISFNYHDDQDKQLMNFQVMNFIFKQQKLQGLIVRSVCIETLFITDYIHKYKNKGLQSLLQTNRIAIEMRKVKKDSQKKIQIDLKIPDIHINWKPDVLIILLQLVYKHFSKEKKLRVDDGIQKTREQLFSEVFSDKKFEFSRHEYDRNSKDRKVKQKRLQYVQKNKKTKQLVKFNCQIQKMQIVMIHRQSHIPMFKLLTDNIKNQLILGENQKFVSGTVKSCYLFELTGYPKNTYSQGKEASQYQIVHPSKSAKNNEPMIDYKWSSYQAFTIPNSERINSFMYIIINPMVFEYFQQVTFRLIDYILIQVILLLNQPDMLVANQNLLQQLRRSAIEIQQFQQNQDSHSYNKLNKQRSPIVKILFSQYEQVIKKIISPYFMDMYFELKKPSIYIRPEKKSQSYYRADFNQVVFSNQNIKSAKRFQAAQCSQAKQYIYEEEYKINCTNCDFYCIRQVVSKHRDIKIHEQRLFQSVSLNLLVNKLIQEDQINEIYPQINTYDRSFYTHSKISELRINKLTKQQYLSLNKLVNFNIIYDDNKDQLFIHNFKLTKLLSPKPIYFSLTIPVIYLSGKEGTQDNFYDLFEIEMRDFRMLFQRNKQLNSSYNIKLKSTTIYGFQYLIDKQTQKNAAKQQKMIPSQHFKIDQKKENKIKYELIQIKNQKKQQQCLETTIKMKPTGQKIIEANILSIQAYLKVHLLQLIFQWSLLEDWVFPVVSNYANDITFHLTIHNMSAWLQETMKYDAKSSINEIKDHQNRFQPKSFQFVGVFCYKFHRKANFSQQHIQQIYRKNQLTTNQINSMPQTSYMTIIMNTQVFHCQMSKNQNIKRQVIEKMTFNLIEKRFYKVSNQQKCTIKTMANRQLNIDRSLFKISFTDVALMGEILQDVGNDHSYIGQLRNLLKAEEQRIKGISITKQQALKKQNQEIEKMQNQTELSSLQNLDIEIQSLSLYLINNSTSSFIPVLKISINNATLNKCNTSKKNLVKGSFTTTGYYFNGSIFRWQPMLQKCQIIFHKLIYNNNNQELPQTTFSSLQSPDNVTLNISKQLVIALKDVIDEWNRNKNKTKNSVKKRPQQIMEKIYHPLDSQSKIKSKESKHIYQSIEMVSQYIIRNQTGYDLEIYSHNPVSLLQIIPNEQQMDYEYELEKYDREEHSEMNILIGVHIRHPKYKFKRITHIPLDFNKQFQVMPVMMNSTIDKTMRQLPPHSVLRFISETKNLKRYCIIQSTKKIQDYTNNQLQTKILQFDTKPNIILQKEPHRGVQASLYKGFENKQYRYIGKDGILKIMSHYLIYNYTPIPLNVNNNQLLPGQFVSIFSSPVIQNIKYRDCKMIRIDKNQNTRSYYIYCEGYVIDYAGLYYQFNSSIDAKTFSHDFMHNGYKFTIYLLPDQQSKFKVRLNKNYKSNGDRQCSASIKLIMGNQNFKLEGIKYDVRQFQTYGYLSQYTGNKYTDFKKIIEIAPFYVIENSTNMKIKVCQIQSCSSMTLQKNERVPFYWEDKRKPFQIKISAFTENQMWGYSGPMRIQQNSYSFVLRNSSNLSDYKIFRIVLQKTNTITLVHVIETDPKKGGLIMLSNKVPGITLKFYQASIFQKDHQIMNPQQYIFTVRNGEDIPFGYQLPLQKHQLVLEVAFDQNRPEYYKAYVNPTIFEDIQNTLFKKHLSIYKQGKRVKKLLMVLNFEGNIKRLQILENYENKPEYNIGEFLCKLPRVNINLIGYKEKIRKEIAALYFDGLQYEQAKTNLTTTHNLIVRSFIIDNCLKIHPIYPVLFASTITKQAQFFINFLMTRDNFNSNLIHYLGICINKFVLSLTSDQIQCLQENIAQLTQAWSSDLNPQLKFRPYEIFKQIDHESIQNNFYFIVAEINPLKSNITFKHVNEWGGRLLKAFASIDNCNVSVDGKKIMHFNSRNISQFLKLVIDHYKDGLQKMIIPMIGNLSILGSPISLAQRIGSGFKDLIELPSEGFNISPLEGGKGLAKGAGSLMKNTFQGAFNSVQSVTGSVGNGISTFVFDEQFNRSRQKIKNDKSQHLGQGLLNGGKSIVNGIGRGLTGVVTEPINGAQEKGIGGFFLGGLKGLTGLVTKPVSGIFDATTKTLEGIKNTPSYFEQKDNKGIANGRIRNPRAFYGYNRQFRSYDEDISLCAKMLVDENQGLYQNLSWFSVYHIAADRPSEKKPLLFLTIEFFVIYDIKQGRIVQSYHCDNIKKATANNKHEVVIAIYDKKAKGIGNIKLKLKQAIGQKLSSEINTICKYYRPIYGYQYQIYQPQFKPMHTKKNQ